MRVELLRLDAHRTSNTIKQRVEWSWLLSPNVIKPIQPTKTRAHTLSLCSPSHTHTHTRTHPLLLQTQSKGHTLPLLSQCLLPASDHWSWCARHVLGPGCTAQSPSATLYCGISGRPFYKHPPREPVSEVPIQPSQELQLPMTLSFHGLGWPPLNPKMTFWSNSRFFDQFVCYEWGMNMIISDHAKATYHALWVFVLWSSLAQWLSIMTLDLCECG